MIWPWNVMMIVLVLLLFAEKNSYSYNYSFISTRMQYENVLIYFVVIFFRDIY